MKEFVTANNRIFECSRIETGLDSIVMTMEDESVLGLEDFFADVTELTISFEGEEDPHGTYKHLELKSVTKNVSDGSVSVTMRIKSEIERRLDALEAEQELQNGAIEELANIAGGER